MFKKLINEYHDMWRNFKDLIVEVADSSKYNLLGKITIFPFLFVANVVILSILSITVSCSLTLMFIGFDYIPLLWKQIEKLFTKLFYKNSNE